jgi:hypothetical protein
VVGDGAEEKIRMRGYLLKFISRISYARYEDFYCPEASFLINILAHSHRYYSFFLNTVTSYECHIDIHMNRYRYIHIYIWCRFNIYTVHKRKTEQMENGNFRLFAADGKRETEVCFFLGWHTINAIKIIDVCSSSKCAILWVLLCESTYVFTLRFMSQFQSVILNTIQ